MSKILLIEDEDQIRNEVMDWLRFEGYDVLGASNGRMGLATIQAEVPDLIVCDIAMPEVDGHEVLMEVRTDLRISHIPFIFLTASATRDAMRKGMELGADDYLTKPFTHSEVLRAIRSRLEKQAALERQQQAQLEMLSDAISEERERHALKSRLTAMFSHDFRNPLSSILASSNMLRNFGDRLAAERKAQQLDRIDASVHLLIQMLDDMLTVAELESGHLGFAPLRINLAELIATLVDEAQMIDQHAHPITFVNHLHHAVEIDPKLLRQILSNLLSNAVKYSPAGAEVVVELSADERGIRISVQDAGIGIPDESLPHLFEPFHRAANARHLRGTGLGLSIVKECAERHQGRVTVASQQNKGTTFVVELPYALS